MKRTDSAFHANHRFQTGNPLTGQRGTRLDHTWLNAVQEELATAIETAGLAIDPSDNSQLAQAIRKLALPVFPTRDSAVAGAARMPKDAEVLYVQGQSVEGIGGARYRRTTVDPYHDAKFRDAEGQLWTLDEVFVTPQMLGALGDGVANDTSSMAAAIQTAIAGANCLLIPAGTYRLDAGGAVNFAAAGLQIIGIGKPVLRFYGAGKGMTFDTLAPPGIALGEMAVSGLIIEGDPGVTDGVFTRGIVRSTFSDIEVRECAGRAFHFQHGVACLYDRLKFSLNSFRNQRTTPEFGLYLTGNGSYYTADCTILNPVFEGFSGTGIHLDNASGNNFIGGTSEVVAKGVVISKGCRRNSFQSLWCEANSELDLEDHGLGSAFHDCYFGSNSPKHTNVEAPSSDGLRITGGFVRAASLGEQSRRTHLCAVAVSDHASLGIRGAGDYTAIGCYAVDIRANRSRDLDDVFTAQADTFTPVLAGKQGRGQIPAARSDGHFERVGRTVEFTLDLFVGRDHGAYGTVEIHGLPFQATHSAAITVGAFSGIHLGSGFHQLCAEIDAGTRSIRLFVCGSQAAAVPLDFSAIRPPARLMLSGRYRV